jgi:hypothetical protein
MRHPHTVAHNYMGCLMEFLGVFNTIYYKNEFQNPQIFQQTISLFPEQSTLVCVLKYTTGFDILYIYFIIYKL